MEENFMRDDLFTSKLESFSRFSLPVRSSCFENKHNEPKRLRSKSLFSIASDRINEFLSYGTPKVFPPQKKIDKKHITKDLDEFWLVFNEAGPK